MIQLVRTFVKNGQKYLFTKNVFTEEIGSYFGSMKNLGNAKQVTHMYLEKIGDKGNTLLQKKKVEGTVSGLAKSIFRTDYIKNSTSLTMIDDLGKIILHKS
ncbi:hypothetical protein J6I39_06190 [bacterium]|nr:hypothetical protein [bacterium]